MIHISQTHQKTRAGCSKVVGHATLHLSRDKPEVKNKRPRRSKYTTEELRYLISTEIVLGAQRNSKRRKCPRFTGTSEGA